MSCIDEIAWIDDSENSRRRYNEIIKKAVFSNIPQSWDYGTVKKNTEKNDLLRGIVRHGNQDVGVIQILLKKKGGITVAARVNRGPILFEEYDDLENHLKALQIVRRRIIHPIPILYAPNIEYSPENLESLFKCHWKQWDSFGYETGIIDLNQSLEDIRKGFDSKWRNQLKSSENKKLEIKTDFTRFSEIVSIYEASQKEKGYKGVPSCVLFALKQLEDNPLHVFYVTNDSNRIIAFDIFYASDGFGLYFVGWIDDEGRKLYVNNLFLYNAVRMFKEKGVRWFDLGGIDYVVTEENARFKDGMHPKHIRLVGEFVKF